MSIWDRFCSMFRRRGQGNVPMNPAGPDFQPGPNSDPPPFTSPAGTRPVLIRTETAHIPGVQDLRFVRREVRFRDDKEAKYSGFETTRVVLAGCNCVVSGPNDVAYMSDISGLPVCTKCARVCLCGHKVGPLERVMVEPGKFMCAVCYEAQRRRERWAVVGRVLLGPFVKRE